MPAHRRALGFAGIIAITLVLDGKGRVAADPSDHHRRHSGAGARADPRRRSDEADQAPQSEARDEEELKENVRRAARRAANDAWGKKPVTRVEIAWV